MNTSFSILSDEDYLAAFMVQQVGENQSTQPYTLQLDATSAEFLAWEGDDKLVIPRRAAQSGLVLRQPTLADFQVIVEEGNGRSRLFQLTQTNWLTLVAWQRGES